MYHKEEKGSRKAGLVMREHMQPFAGKIEGTTVEQASREPSNKASVPGRVRRRSPEGSEKYKGHKDRTPRQEYKAGHNDRAPRQEAKAGNKDRTPRREGKVVDTRNRSPTKPEKTTEKRTKGQKEEYRGKGKKYDEEDAKYNEKKPQAQSDRNKKKEEKGKEASDNKSYRNKLGSKDKEEQRHVDRGLPPKERNKGSRDTRETKAHSKEIVDQRKSRSIAKPSNKKEQKLLTATLTTENNPPKKNARFTPSKSLGGTSSKRVVKKEDDLKEINDAIKKLKDQNERERRGDKGKRQQSPDLNRSVDPRKGRQSRLPTREPLRETTVIRDNARRTSKAEQDMRHTWHQDSSNGTPAGRSRMPAPPSTAASPPSRMRPTSSKYRGRSYTAAEIQLVSDSNAGEKMNKKRQSESSVQITRNVKGWYLREQMQKLKERILQKHSPTMRSFNIEYKGMLTRVQRRYGVKEPLTPFDINQVNNFLDLKEQYEKVFTSMKQDNKLPRQKVRDFYVTCNLTADEEQINKVFSALFQACDSRGDVVFMVDCASDLSVGNQHIQGELVDDLINCLHIGQGNMRVGYIPYNTEVLQCFGLEDHGSRDELLKALDTVKIEHGHKPKSQSRSDLALKKMQDMFKAFPRKNAPRTAVLVSAGSSYVSNATGREAMSARKAGINVIVVGVGHREDRRELVTIAGGSDSIFYLCDKGHILKVKTQILNKAQFVNCEHCYDVSPTYILNDRGGGLVKEDLLELVWTHYPPPETGIDDQTRQEWLQNKVEPDEDVKLIGGEGQADTIQLSKNKVRERTWVSEAGGRQSQNSQSQTWEINMETNQKPKTKPYSKRNERRT